MVALFAGGRSDRVGDVVVIIKGWRDDDGVPRRPALRRQLRRPRWGGGATRRRRPSADKLLHHRTGHARPVAGSSPVAGAVSSTIPMSAFHRWTDTAGEAPRRALVNYPRAKARGADIASCADDNRVRTRVESRSAAAAAEGQSTSDSGGQWTRTPQDHPGPGARHAGDAAPMPPMSGRRGHTEAKQGRVGVRQGDVGAQQHGLLPSGAGCKRFRNLRGFAGKLAASKCSGRRARSRRLYEEEGGRYYQRRRPRRRPPPRGGAGHCGVRPDVNASAAPCLNICRRRNVR